MNKIYYIYGHWTKDTNELFYIGVGTRKDRMHTKRGRNQYWLNIVAKHGYEAEIILNRFTDRDEAVKEEIRLQQLNQPRACLQYGDRLNKIVSDETRAKMSLVQKGNKNKAGSKLSIETRERISLAGKGNKNGLGHKHTPETKANMAKIKNKSVISCRGQAFESIKAASQWANLKSKSTICDAISGKSQSAGKYSDKTKIKWSFNVSTE